MVKAEHQKLSSYHLSFDCNRRVLTNDRKPLQMPTLRISTYGNLSSIVHTAVKHKCSPDNPMILHALEAAEACDNTLAFSGLAESLLFVSRRSREGKMPKDEMSSYKTLVSDNACLHERPSFEVTSGEMVYIAR